MLLEDVFIINNLKVLNEGKAGPMKIGGTFQRADEENNNKRIYPKSLLMREVTKLEEAMKNRRLMGELDHPKQDSVSLSNVSHLVTSLKMEGNELVGEAEILNTPMGKVAQALIEGGVQIGISSRGMGTLSEGQDGKRYVNEDFRLVTWDIVADPSTRGAFPALSESVSNVNSLLVEEIMGEVLPRVTKQKVFATLLREGLTEMRTSSDQMPNKPMDEARDRGNDWSDDNDQWSSRDSADAAKGSGRSKSTGATPAQVSHRKEQRAIRKAATKKAAAKRKADLGGYNRNTILGGPRQDSSPELFRGVRASQNDSTKDAAADATVVKASGRAGAGRRVESSTELFRGVRARLSEMETPHARKKRKQWKELQNAVKLSKVTLPEPKPKPKPKPEKP